MLQFHPDGFTLVNRLVGPSQTILVSHVKIVAPILLNLFDKLRHRRVEKTRRASVTGIDIDDFLGETKIFDEFEDIIPDSRICEFEDIPDSIFTVL